MEEWTRIRRRILTEGVPTRITYDNPGCGDPGPRERKLTDGFLQLMSHNLFAPHFCLVRRANEEGVVESVVRYGRLQRTLHFFAALSGAENAL